MPAALLPLLLAAGPTSCVHEDAPPPALLDDAGRIWVSAFRTTTDTWSQEEAWHVLDPTGTPLARVRLPPRARLAAVRGNRVALVARDEVDVEHVRVFPLIGPEEAR